jgi:anti-sigma factor RsiW
MIDMTCGYGGDRDEILVAYIYGDIEPAQRAEFDAHLTKCVHCRTELAELRGVRVQLEQWAPPEPLRALTRQSAPHAGPRARVWATLAEMPAWAQVAAALVFLGIAAGLANLDVRYNREGLTVRTGWTGSAVAQDPAAGAARGVPSGAAQNVAQGGAQGVAQGGSQGVAQDFSPAYTAAAWRADLAALERQLRREFRASRAPGVTLQPASAQTGSAAANGARDGEMLRRMRALVEESERKQQRELALRVAQVIRDVNAQREADLVKIDRSLGLIQNNTGVEAMKQRELLNYLVRVSQKQ